MQSAQSLAPEDARLYVQTTKAESGIKQDGPFHLSETRQEFSGPSSECRLPLSQKLKPPKQQLSDTRQTPSQRSVTAYFSPQG